MKIQLRVSHRILEKRELEGRTALMVNTLSAVPTLLSAFEKGARQAVPAADIDEAAMIMSQLGGDGVLICDNHSGELSDIELLNSPYSMYRSKVAGKTLVLCTENASSALLKCKEAEKTILTCMNNSDAVAMALASCKTDLTVVCAGDEGRLSIMDMLTAGSVISALLEYTIGVKLDERATLALLTFERCRGDIEYIMYRLPAVRRMLKKGLEADVHYCLKENTTSALPVYEDGVILIKKRSYI